jgi:two-component system chemotaxis sensor kinase CheA
MVDFSVFDSILDIIFVIAGDGKIAYCNDAAATFVASSVRRLSGKVFLSDIFSFSEPGLLPFNDRSQGRLSPTPFIETAFDLPKAGKKGKVQLAIRPIGDGQHWGVFIKDVSLEETLAAKYRAELAKTEEYARNLEKLVAARTAELAAVNQTLKAILNSLGQGFFTFDARGECGSVFTKACEDILEGVPTARKAWDVLGVKGEEQDQFRKWSESLFKEFLPFDDLKGLGPNLFPHSHHKHVVLDYFPIRNEKEGIGEVVVVATDKTAEHEAQQALESERQYAAMVVKFMKNKDQFLQFLSSVGEAFETLKQLSARDMNAADIGESFRILHTLEGEAGTFSVRELREHSRLSQHCLEPFKGEGLLTGSPRTQFVQSLTEMEEKFAGFLRENQGIFRLQKGQVARTVELPLDNLHSFMKELEHDPSAEKLARRYRELFLRVQVEDRLKYYDSLVQNVAERLGKKVKPLQVEGADFAIFPEPYQKFFSSMVHAFRNAVDHGLEMPDEREWAGKEAAGQIRVQVRQEAGWIHFQISDDGKGIDPAVIRAKLAEKFPAQDFSAMADEEVIQQVSLPGFSSRDEIGEFSGRGVGLDALREEVLKLGGQMHLKSKVGEGTTIEIQVPVLDYEVAVLRSA